METAAAYIYKTSNITKVFPKQPRYEQGHKPCILLRYLQRLVGFPNYWQPDRTE